MANIFKRFLEANKISLIRDGEKTIITCDAIISENHQMNAEATQYEIEDGSDISDHIINRGKLLTIEGIVSDDPITILQTGMLSRTIAAITPGVLKSKLSFGLSGDKGRPSKEAYDHFEEIYDKKIPVTIITGLKKWDNMIMEDISIPRTSKTVRSLNFTATFRQVRMVSAILVTAPSVHQDVELGAQNKKNIGKQSTNSLTDTNKGLAKSIKDWFFGLF